MSFSITLARILNYGLLSLWRNRWLTISAIAVMTITLLMLSSLLIINNIASVSAQGLKDRVNISVFIEPTVTEDKIAEIKKEFESYDEIKSVEYVSAEQALESFKKLHANDPDIQQSLQQLDENPLQPSLIITAHELSEYPIINEKLKRSRFQPLMQKINYEDTRTLIAKLDSITSGIRNFGISLTLVFGFIAMVVMFNTLRLTIFSRREEIEIMRLVGASNFYIRGPFLLEGIFYGACATVLASAILYPAVRVLTPSIIRFFDLASTDGTYLGAFWLLPLIQLGVGILLGVASGIVATKKHLNV